MGYTNLDKLLNVVLTLKYDWITKVDIPYSHTTYDGKEIYNVHIYINRNILNLVSLDNIPKRVYKIPLDEFERKTGVKFKSLTRDIDDLFHNQMISSRVDQEIWFYIPLELRQIGPNID